MMNMQMPAHARTHARTQVHVSVHIHAHARSYTHTHRWCADVRYDIVQITDHCLHQLRLDSSDAAHFLTASHCSCLCGSIASFFRVLPKIYLICVYLLVGLELPLLMVCHILSVFDPYRGS